MSLLNRLERRFGRYAVENVTLLLIAGQAFVFMAQYLMRGGAGDLYERLRFAPDLVMQGEVWRLVTFVFLAPLSTHLIFVVFFWLLFYTMGTALESAWGAFRYNVFLVIGYLASVAATLLTHTVAPGGFFGTSDYLYGSVFLAFARLYPDFQIMLFFVLPVKVRWLALITWLFYGYQLLFSTTWIERALIVAAVLNYLVFFGREIWLDVKQGHRRNVRRAKTHKQPTKIVHECRVCGLTSETDPKASFRYCSKCDGQCCYCAEHIRDHECVRADAESKG